MSTTRRQLLAGACSACALAALGITPASAQAAAPPDGVDPALFAKDRFLSHWNCTQAVLESLAPQAGMSPEAVTKITTPFAAGMWSGLTCGAVTGAMMAIGMRYGRSSDGDGKATETTTAKVRLLVAEMTRQFGDLNCSALLGTDMATDAGIKEAAGKGLFKSKCPVLVEAAAREAMKLMA
jgi:C_GCAxxG_C_C family probable redox protein